LENQTHTRIITVTSGKGGVGKTNISTGTALALANRGYRVCLFDADLGLANINILFGLDPEYNIEDLISGEKSLDDILIRNFNGIDIIPGSSGVESIANLNESGVRTLINSLDKLQEYDFLIFDTSAGIASPVIAFCMAASEILLVLTPEPTSLTDAYALLKVLTVNGFKGKTRIVVNQCLEVNQAKKIFMKFHEAAIKHLNIKVTLTGVIFTDTNLTAAVKEQKAFLKLYPDSKASKCLNHLAQALISTIPEENSTRSLAQFWEQCFNMIKSPLSLKGIRGNANTRHEAMGEIEPAQQVEGTSPQADEKLKEPSPAVTKIDSNKQDMTEYPDPAQDKSTDYHMPVLIRELIDSVTMVSDELRKIRESMGKQQPGTFAGTTAFKEAAEIINTNNNMFIIDYEAFLKKHHA
jgi:flagellar biosynthesis protein FlhG